MKTLFRTIAVTFARYSRIPMPHLDYREEDMVYSLCVFPWVGAVIGVVFTVVYRIAAKLALPSVATALILLAIPLLITGGFHFDGFLDVQDALASYRSPEEKRQILKDPHIGSFAVIRAILYVLLVLSGLLLIVESENALRSVQILSCGFFFVRALCGWTILRFRPAKKEGMMAEEAGTAALGKTGNERILLVEIVVAGAFMIRISPVEAFAGIATVIVTGAWTLWKSKKEFGGITGDTAGFFVTLCEGAGAFVCGLFCFLR